MQNMEPRTTKGTRIPMSTFVPVAMPSAEEGMLVASWAVIVLLLVCDGAESEPEEAYIVPGSWLCAVVVVGVNRLTILDRADDENEEVVRLS